MVSVFIKVREAVWPKNKSHTNFYECCDLTKKEYLRKVPTNVESHIAVWPMRILSPSSQQSALGKLEWFGNDFRVIYLLTVIAHFLYLCVSQLRLAVAFSALAHEEFQPHYCLHWGRTNAGQLEDNACTCDWHFFVHITVMLNDSFLKTV